MQFEITTRNKCLTVRHLDLLLLNTQKTGVGKGAKEATELKKYLFCKSS